MIKNFEEIKRNEISLFGGKATNLSFLMQNGFNVPGGFCISTKITQLGKKTEKEIIKQYKKLNSKVSVRSSATVEDAKNASFAGQFDTFLNIDSEKKLIKAINDCWKSASSSRAKSYSKNKNIKNAKMAVIVQKMVDTDFAGVIFSIDPIYKKHLLIEVVKGLGDKLVSGEVTPNTYFIDRKNFKIIKKEIQFSFDEQKLSEIAEVVMEIEKLYKSPQDIEFCIKSRKIYVLQSRPITTL